MNQHFSTANLTREPGPRSSQGGVLIIVENLPVPFDRRVWQEATALQDAGYDVSVICPKGKGFDKAKEVLDGVHVYRHGLPMEGTGALGYLIEYSTALFHEFRLSLKVRRQRGFHVLHACNPPDLIFLIALFHKIVFGTRFLFDQHDINPELFEVKFGRKGFFHGLLRGLERWTFRVADGSLATNATLKDLAIERGGMPADRVWVVKSYPDLKTFQRVERDASVRRGHDYLVGYVGILAEQDGVEALVDAMAHVTGTLGRTDIGCVIIGDGPQFEPLRQRARALGVDRHIHFAGYVSGHPLLAKLSACDIGVIPDQPNVANDKMSMNKVFEYMALGLPIVQFDLAQARLEAGAASRVVATATATALGDEIVTLLEDPEARQRMSAYGRERAAREFQWENEKRALLSAYECLMHTDPVEVEA